MSKLLTCTAYTYEWAYYSAKVSCNEPSCELVAGQECGYENVARLDDWNKCLRLIIYFKVEREGSATMSVTWGFYTAGEKNALLTKHRIGKKNYQE